METVSLNGTETKDAEMKRKTFLLPASRCYPDTENQMTKLRETSGTRDNLRSVLFSSAKTFGRCSVIYVL